MCSPTCEAGITSCSDTTDGTIGRMELRAGLDKKTAMAGGIALLVVVAIAIYYFSSRTPAPPVSEESVDVSAEVSGATQAPVPETNPFRAETNPFKEYKNPFE